jgi:hypothetical protein
VVNVPGAVPSSTTRDGDEDHLDGLVCLKLKDSLVTLVSRLFAVDTSEGDGGVFEEYFDEVERECPVGKHDAGVMSALT